MREVDKMQKRGKRTPKYFERPEGTQEDVTEMDGLRNRKNVFRLLSVGRPRSMQEIVPQKKSFSVVVQQQTEGLVLYKFLIRGLPQ